jgi:hypothetical protein
MIDFKRYYRLHPEGLCSVIKGEGDQYIVLFKRFDNENGKELPSEPHYTTIKQLHEDLNTLSIQIEALNSIIIDIGNL